MTENFEAVSECLALNPQVQVILQPQAPEHPSSARSGYLCYLLNLYLIPEIIWSKSKRNASPECSV